MACVVRAWGVGGKDEWTGKGSWGKKEDLGNTFNNEDSKKESRKMEKKPTTDMFIQR